MQMKENIVLKHENFNSINNVKTDLFAKSQNTSLRGHPWKFYRGSWLPKEL